MFTVYQLQQALRKVEQQLRAVMMTPKYSLPFLQNGRLVRVKVGERKEGNVGPRNGSRVGGDRRLREEQRLRSRDDE